MALYSAEDGSHLRNWWLKTPRKWLNSSAIINEGVTMGNAPQESFRGQFKDEDYNIIKCDTLEALKKEFK